MVASVQMLALASRSSIVRSVALCLVVAAALAGCTRKGGTVPVNSAIYAFQPVDPDDYAPEEPDEAEDTSGAADDASGE
jgi:hypothetical protein